ncbi:sidekick-1-like protein [Labeo rohita]|uniref:Sidekick-1-like protein n=1 Tax=Labeo rohita TaxID=84645 RepID=A0A498MEC1_LABRO|nr:sidekick-1-like protein [Labeo rohita]
MNRLGTQKSGSRLVKGCSRSVSLILEQRTETWSSRFEGVAFFSAKYADEGESFQKAVRHESQATGKVADSELNSPACGMNENRLVNAVKRSAHFRLFSQTSTSAEVIDSSFSGGQSPLTKGKVNGIIHRQGNTRKEMTGKAKCGMWGWIFALVFLWNTHMLRAQVIGHVEAQGLIHNLLPPVSIKIKKNFKRDQFKKFYTYTN